MKGAFLHYSIPVKDRIVIKLPKITGSAVFKEQFVQLLKSLYGLRQSPKMWYEVLSRTLGKFGFCKTGNSEILFIRPGHDPVYIVAYVDDLLVLESKYGVNKAQKYLASSLVTTELGSCTHYLGIRMSRTKTGIFYHKRHLRKESSR